MSKPWSKKNPLLSVFLSGANAWAGAARGMWAAEFRRQHAEAMKEGSRQAASFWTAALTPPAPGRKKPRKRR
ncbi:hypothetical protein [Roseomonas xinghualingensis]|uniref:hypothetical protein n=1 Tax=Roseomonas xinghualingensis TaxID=2986475 RepID=UPI0021F11134|nr:hypothetical protein [Roseomonas sp. SXEYE001]MCV4209632.1 hypothetical protein [Roseomonas sp. SXEYE001]